MIDAILKFANKHARAVIVALLGIIAAGSVGGGLWVNSLRASLDYDDNRLGAIEERHRTQLTDLRRELTLWKDQAEDLRTELGALTSDISLVHDELISIQSGSEAPGDETIDSVLEQVTLLHQRAAELERSLSVSDETIQVLRRFEEEVYLSEPSSAPLLWLALAGVLLVTVITVLLIRVRRR